MVFNGLEKTNILQLKDTTVTAKCGFIFVEQVKNLLFRPSKQVFWSVFLKCVLEKVEDHKIIGKN